MLKVLKNLKFRRLLLIIEVIFQFLLMNWIIAMIFSTIFSTDNSSSYNSFAGITAVLLSFQMIAVQFVIILVQSLIQNELAQIRWLSFPILFFILGGGAMLVVASSKFIIWLVFCLILQIFYTILSIYHCNLLFKKTEKSFAKSESTLTKSEKYAKK